MRMRRIQHHPFLRVRGFTLVELMIVVLIMSIISVIGLNAVADYEAHQRADRAARESLALLRFARNLAMASGQSRTVRIISGASPAVATVGVYTKNVSGQYDAYTTGMTSSNGMVLDLGAKPELVGTAIAPLGTTDFVFDCMGSCSASGTLSFTYANRSQTITIPKVGDPTIP